MSEVKVMDQVTALKIREGLQADCEKCFGLCCTALNIMASSDFAINKDSGTPCPNLQTNFRCGIHNQLRQTGFKGCTVFDCLGAGQMVSQVTFHGQSWREQPELSDAMFHVFPIMEQLYEMIAYVSEALSYKVPRSMREGLTLHIEQLESLTRLEANQLLQVDIMKYRMPVNDLLLKTSLHIRNELMSTMTNSTNRRKLDYRGTNWMGKKLQGKDLRATDLRGALLIAADLRNTDLRGVDFIGADLRDADVSGANLSTSMFLTQMQMNSAKGNEETRLPSYLHRPSHWGDEL